ncbi:ankyrin repeat-containing domain protein [Aspergillus novoparasiticus]|uniref:Ankyrin repeat-containing domain protein n=1 Tax=Aspergillus novoparasiticus TaxID=986946 RepID=A0A5N6E7M1_9EURO|nr:ankyrin repeat-containing domain protein [Aspergillus novoparasiticus]
MSFSDLPSELVLHMATMLHSLRDIYALMSVSTGLYRLLKKCLYQYNVDHDGSSGLIRAVKRGSLSATCYFLSLPQVDVHVRDNDGQAITHIAAQQRDGFYTMKILLRDSRININATDLEGQTPFFYAVKHGNKETVKQLLDDPRLDPNMCSSISPLAIAAANGSLELLEMLLCDERVDVNNQMHRSIHPLIIALFQGEGSIPRFLRVPNVNFNCCWGTMSALMWGITFKRTTSVIELLKKDLVDVNYQDNAGRTALMLAIEEANDEVSMALLNRKEIDLTLTDAVGQKALDYALKSDDSRTLEILRNRLAVSNDTSNTSNFGG